MKDKMIVFEDKIRKIWDAELEEWFYSIVDVVGILSGSLNPRKYWNKLAQRLRDEESQVVTDCHQLKMRASDGKMRETDCADTKGVLRIVQSISSRKAEPFKLWLAKVGSERIDEAVDPELSIDRAMKNYLAKGHSEKWINQRLKTIEIRKELTDEWKRSGVEEGQEFAILTNEITLAWSGKSIRGYKEFKGLKKENLRDNMTNLELALNTLAEATTTEISKKESPKTFDENKGVAKRGGDVAGVARRKVEDELGHNIISSEKSEEIINSNKEREIQREKLKVGVENE